MARDAELLAQVVATLGDKLPPELQSADAISKLCSVSLGRETGTILLEVRYRDAQLCADIANTWASLFVSWASASLPTGADSIAVLEPHALQAAQRLAEAQQALVDYEASDSLNVISTTLGAQWTAVADYAATEEVVGAALEQMQSLGQQLRGASPVSRALLDELDALSVQLTALAGDGRLLPRVWLALQRFRNAADSSGSVERLVTLTDALQRDQQALTAARERAAANVAQSYQRLAQARAERANVERALNLAEDTSLALERELQELRLASQLPAAGLKVAALAPRPRKPVSPDVVLNAAVGAVLGLVLGIGTAFALEYLVRPAQANREG